MTVQDIVYEFANILSYMTGDKFDLDMNEEIKIVKGEYFNLFEGKEESELF